MKIGLLISNAAEMFSRIHPEEYPLGSSQKEVIRDPRGGSFLELMVSKTN